MAIPLAKAFKFCPRCGTSVARAGRNPLVCAACEFTYHFSPVSAVVGIIGNRRGEVLFLERAKDPGRGLLGLPGGFIDPGESAEDALAREIREEVNLELVRADYLTSFANTYVYRGVTIPVTDMIYVAQVASVAPLRIDPGEIAAARLLKPGQEQLDRMAFVSNRRGLETYLERRQRRRRGSRTGPH